MRELNSERGITLIELITTVAVLGIISANAISTFKTYRETAANVVAEHTLKDTRTALQAALIEPEEHETFLGLTTQSTQGPLTNPVMRSLLPGFQVPKNIRVSLYFDPECDSVGCTSEFLQVSHCLGRRFAMWERYGDGSEIQLTSIVGPGCA